MKPSNTTSPDIRKFLDPDGYPAVAPPWGTLNAIDLNTGKYLWKIPFGEYPELAAKGMTQTGSENYGGPILTASGLLIIGATIFDRKIRAYDSDTGRAALGSRSALRRQRHASNLHGRRQAIHRHRHQWSARQETPAGSGLRRVCPALSGECRAVDEHNPSVRKFSFDLRNRSIQIDRPARIPHNHRLKAKPLRIERRIPNAEVISQPGQKDSRQPSLAQISSQPSRRRPVIFKERRI